jgi:hypothetical protein
MKIGFKISVIGLGGNSFTRVADEIVSILDFDDALYVDGTFA